MRKGVGWLVAIGLSLGAVSGTAFAESKSEASKRAVVERFFQLRERMLDQRGAPADVDALVSLLADKVVYEHPVAKVSMSKADVRAGMIAHLKEGRDAKLTLRRVLIGADFAVVETTLHYSLSDKSGDFTASDRNGVSVFQFDGDRITRVAEY